MMDKQDHPRPHRRVFVNGLAVKDLAHALAPGGEVTVVQALSGG
jgi:hypothetical protein